MGNIIPFESAGLPAYLKGVDVAALNADLTSHTGAGYPVISIKGKTFAVVRNGERTILPNPKDPDSPATNIDVVIVKASKQTAKIFYLKKFEEGVDAKPDCYSNDGITPAADATSPQAKACGTCKHNAWGSRVTDNGKKGKACGDAVRIAVTTPGQLNEPYLMRVPPASFKPMAEYGQMLAKRGVAYNMVVTKIGFDPEAATPLLTFKPVGFLDDAAYKEVQETAASETVAQIVTGGFPTDAPPTPEDAAAAAAAKAALATAAGPSKEPKVTDAEVVAAVKAADPVVATAPVAGTAAAAAEPTAEVDLDNLSFDD